MQAWSLLGIFIASMDGSSLRNDWYERKMGVGSVEVQLPTHFVIPL